MYSRVGAFLLTLLARGQAFVYALSQTGQLTVNGTLLDKLPGGSDQDESWRSLFVKGSDFFAIRADGRVTKTGAKLYDLAFDDELNDLWIDVVVTDDDAVWALRTDGRLSRNGESVGDLNEGLHQFMDLTTDGTDVFTLRSDDRLYDEGGEALVNLTKSKYRRCLISMTPTDLTKLKNA